MGSVRESFAIRAHKRSQEAEFLKFRAIIEAIIYAANGIAGSDPSSDTLESLISSVKNILLPDLAEEKEDKATKVKELMKAELERGPFKVEAMDFGKGRSKKGMN